jgi:nitroreductase
VRSFKPQKVSDVLIKQVIQAGSMAPSACNFQPWVFVVITDDQIIDQVHQAYHRDWFGKTKQIIAICGNHEQSWKRAIDFKDHCEIDVAIAVDHMTLMAAELGLGTCWVCNFNPGLISKALKLPPHIEPIVLLPIGYPEGIEPSSKLRRPPEQVTYLNYYGNQ